MSYDDKVAKLAELIRPHMKFSDVRQAEEYRDSWKELKYPAGRNVKQAKIDLYEAGERRRLEVEAEIHRLADQFLCYADNPACNIGEHLRAIGVGAHADKVRRSALREAIRLCARNFLERRNMRIEKELTVEEQLVTV